MRQEGFDIVFSRREQTEFDMPPSVSMFNPGELEQVMAGIGMRQSELLEYASGVPASAEVNELRQSYFDRATDHAVLAAQLGRYLAPEDVVNADMFMSELDESGES